MDADRDTKELPQVSDVFSKTYENYLDQIRDIDLSAVAPVLGGQIKDNRLVITFFDDDYEISPSGITARSGEKVPFPVKVVLLKYIILSPEEEPAPSSEWCTFKDFRDAAPLITYFNSNAQKPVESAFTGRLKELEKAALSMRGTFSPIFGGSYDLSMMFHALPKLPMVLNFNDSDSEFEASCSILYQKNSAHYLDMECVAIIGAYLANKLLLFIESSA